MTDNMTTQNYGHAASRMRLAKIIPTSALKGRLFLTLLMMLLTTMTAWAETVTTYYVDADGTRHDNITATVLTSGGETRLSAGWYVVTENITYTGTVTLDGDVNIILADGKTMNVGTSESRISGGDVTITGGQVTATGGEGGIYSYDGTINLGWTNATDRITASSYTGTVIIASGKAFYNGSEVLSGTISDMSQVDGKTLTPTVAIADNADNTSAIATAATVCTGDKTLAVQLSGRTLYKDGKWNTLCLPFNVTIAGSPLSGDNVEAMVLNGGTSGLSGTTLTLNFDAAPATIPAGTPFIIRWGTPQDNPGTTLTDPVFNGVTVSNTTNDVDFTGGSFKGTYDKMAFAEENKSILFVGDDNNLHWPLSGASLGACRAYFQLADGSPAHEFVLNFGDGSEEMGISPAEIKEITESAGAWYTINGVRLNSKPTKKGLYIHNGRKVVIK